MNDYFNLEPEVARHDVRVLADKLALLYKQSFPAVFISLITAFLLAYVLWSYADRVILGTWLGLMTMATLLRLLVFVSYFRGKPVADEIIKWQKPYFITLMISSVLWGVGALVLILDLPQTQQVIVFYFIMGMSGGAIAVYSALRYTAIATVSAVLLPVIFWALLQGGANFIILAVAGLIFYISALRATKVLANTLHTSFQLTHELTEAKENAEWLSRIDSLTLMNNRRSFTELAESQRQFCLRNNMPYAVIVIDIDRFKAINDTQGHAMGDLALQQVSRLINKTVRKSDICGRIGGEEFSVFLPDTDKSQAQLVAEKIRTTIEAQSLLTERGQLQMTASLGGASGTAELETMMRFADQAMYQAKQQGRNLVCMHHEDI